MRLYAFRAKQKDTKNWVYSINTGVLNFWEMYNDDEFDDETLTDYTGCRDKNGNMIYEGDIVKSPYTSNAMVVRYMKIIESDDMTCPGIGYQFNASPEDMEIIGNVFDNPEIDCYDSEAKN